jgi:DNA-binding XRE family transcriptional regulator
MKGNINEDHLFQIRKIIGQWLIQLREEKGLTQNQLAEEMGITRTTVSKIESGKWNYGIDTLTLFAQHLDFIPMLIRNKHKAWTISEMIEMWDAIKKDNRM